MPVLTVSHNRRAKAGGGGFDHLKTRFSLGADDARHETFDDACLFTRDFLKRLAEELLVVYGHRRDDGDGRVGYHVCGIQPPAKADLKQGIIRRAARKGEQGGASGDLEIGDRLTAVGGIAFVQHSRQRVLGDQRSCEPDAFMKTRQMRRGIGVHRFAGGF